MSISNIMTASIKRRLLFAFIGIIALLLIPIVSFIVINYNIEAQYKKTIETMLLEYRITETSDALASLYNSLLQDINNKEILSKYALKTKEIDDIFFRLDKTITFEKSRTIFKRLEGTIGFVKEYCKKGLENTLKGDFSRNSEILEQISRAKNNIRQDTSDFILAELEFAAEQQQKLQTVVKLSWILGLTLFVFVITGGVILAFIWSGGISGPLVKLSKLAEDISKGNLQLKVQKEFLERKDEIGSLAGSFNTMFVNLRKNIIQFNESNEQLEEKNNDLLREVNMRKKAEVYLKTIFDSVQAGVVLIDPEQHKIVDINPIAIKMFGVPNKENIVGSVCHQFICPAEVGKCPITDLDQTVDNSERVLLTAKGERVPIIKTVVTVLLDNRRYILESFVDITERKKAEEELKRAYDKLKAAQVQLVQSAKMASIGQLAGGVAHEINNPLTGVLNNVQLIRMEQEEKGELNAAEFKELLGVIEESALRCKKITQSLLDFSYASKGIVQPVSLNELIDKVTELIAYEIKRQNIVVQKQFQPDLPKVSGDSQFLQQVIFDIISNAKWAIQQKSGKEGGTITIKTEYEPEAKQVCISISDTGIGIPPENLQRIFEPFFTTKPVGEGTGLGLSVAYNIIKEHKGSIEVESKVNESSTFRIKLPL